MQTSETVRQLRQLFYPGSVALIGASQELYKPNGRPLVALLEHGFSGRIYPVNPNYTDIYGIKCYHSVKDIPDEVDLAIVGVTAEKVQQVIEECADKRVKFVIILTSGFAEESLEGKKRQNQIVELARPSGMRIVGPNCVGVINNLNGLWATFVPRPTDLEAATALQTAGSRESYKFRVPTYETFYPLKFSMISQSGFFGMPIFGKCERDGIGFSYYVSIGNEADLDFSDFIEYMAADPETHLICGYMEGIKNGKKMIDAAEKAFINKKPLAILKAGKTEAGAKAVSSHTGSLVGSDQVYDAFFRQKDVIRVYTIEQFFALINVVASGRIPKGRRVGIVSASGGAGVLLADMCSEYGFELVAFDESTRRQLTEMLPSFASAENPVDITSSVIMEPSYITRSIEFVVKDPNIDIAIIPINLESEFASMLRLKTKDLLSLTDKPIVMINWSSWDEEISRQEEKIIRTSGIPIIDEMEHGIWALSSLVKWTEKQQSYLQTQSLADVPIVSSRREKAEFYFKKAGEKKILDEHMAKEVLSLYSIPTTPEAIAMNCDEAIRSAHEMGFPVALKILSQDIMHKTDAGGIQLNLSTPEEVERGYFRLLEDVKNYNSNAVVQGVLVQKMISPGIEVIIGVKEDVTFGHVVLFGLGGIFVEALEDVSIKIAPLSREDAAAMLQEIKGRKVLEGLRGQPPADTEALIDIILKVSTIAVDLGDKIKELDINPVIVHEKGKGAIVVDALIIS